MDGHDRGRRLARDRARTLYRIIDEGDLVAYKMGRVVRVKRADLKAYVEASRVEPGSLGHLYPPRVDGADEDDQPEE